MGKNISVQKNIGNKIFSNHLGSNYPYHISDNLSCFYDRIDNAIPFLENPAALDPVGIVEFITKFHLLGTRTLIKGIKRTPWMMYPKENNTWTYFDIPQHGTTKLPVIDIAQKFKAALIEECLEYIQGKKTIGILLSGGLDSRIVAGIVKLLQLEKRFSGDVIALTWGVKESRDVQYAQRISINYGWEWQHFELNPEILKKNINTAGLLGAEFSPLHLHAMENIRELNGIDLILAGSYGDSVGRAEFSGKHLLQLPKFVNKRLDRYGFIRNDVIEEVRSIVFEDAYNYRNDIIRHNNYAYREIEQQMHYMRRKLQCCMNFISEKIPLKQMFTSPATFGLMWNLDPSCRNDNIYECLLSDLPGKISEIPWARTGKKLGDSVEGIDNFTKLNHKYGLWLRNDLSDYIKKNISELLNMNLGIFNEKTVIQSLSTWQKGNTVSANRLDEILSWMASLSVFLNHIKINNNLTSKCLPLKDNSNSIIGISELKLYIKIRNIVKE